MKFYSVFLALLFSLVAPSALAAHPTLKGCLSRTVSGLIAEKKISLRTDAGMLLQIHLPKDLPAPKEAIAAVAESIDRIRAVTPNLRFPSSIDVRLKMSGHSISWGGNRVQVIWNVSSDILAERLYKAEHQKNPIYAKAILAHEVGHLLFKENLPSSLRKYASEVETVSAFAREAQDRLEASYPQYQLEKKQLEERLQEIRKELKTKNLSFERRRSLRRDLVRFGRRDADIDRLRNEPYQWFDFLPDVGFSLHRTAAHEELFSDLVALVAADDPLAQDRLFWFSGAKNNGWKSASEGGVKEARISQEIDAHTRRARSFVSENSLDGWVDASVYGGLGPTRTHIWKKYLSRRPSVQERARILEGVYRAITSEVEAIEANFKPEYWELPFSPQEANERLIKKIDVELARP